MVQEAVIQDLVVRLFLVVVEEDPVEALAVEDSVEDLAVCPVEVGLVEVGKFMNFIGYKGIRV